MEEMAFPRSKVNVQTGIPHVVAASFEGLTRKPVVKAPHFFSHLIPRNPDERLGGSGRKIHYDKVAFFVLDPTPTQNIHIALVIGPAAPLAKSPLPVPEDVVVDLLQ